MENFNQANSTVAAAADPNNNEEYERPKVHYVCGGKLVSYIVQNNRL